MFKGTATILLIFFCHCFVAEVNATEPDLRKAKLLCEKKIREATKELVLAKKTRNKEIKTAIKEYAGAIERVKIEYTKREDLEKALAYKEKHESLLRQSIYEFIPSDVVKTPKPEEFNPPENPEVVKQPEEKIEIPDNDLDPPEEIVKKPEVINTVPEEVVKKPEEINTGDSHGSVENFESSTKVAKEINIGLDEVLSCSYNEKTLKDYGYSVSGSCISGPVIEGNETLFVSNKTYEFKGKCEYCFKIKARWYQGVLLMIDDKIYQLSYGHWANNGARIITKGQLETSKAGEKIIENDQVLTRLKGKPYKVQRKMEKEWNEIKIVIENGNICYIYNGQEMHKQAVDIPEGAKIRYGFSTYRCEAAVKDFSLKL